MSSMLLARRKFLAAGLGCTLLSGCDGGTTAAGKAEAIWGRHGLSDGKFHKPRAITVDAKDQLYIVDMTGRIQVFTTQGEFLRVWNTPAIYHGKPCGLSLDQNGNLMVADTHYFRVLFYTPEGELIEQQTIGGEEGNEPGKFGFVTDAVQDSAGNYFVAEYGQYDRIQMFSRDGEFLTQWGGHGEEPGQFLRPQCLALDQKDQIWVADACNHRIQVFRVSGTQINLDRHWGQRGRQVGQLRYPYGILLDGRGHVYTCEYGNHRVQKFTLDGKPLASWGSGGRGEGQLDQPWAIALDSDYRLHILDTYNHRVQTIRL